MPRHVGQKLTGFHGTLDGKVRVAWIEEPYLEVRSESMATARKCVELLIASRGKQVEWNDYDAALAAETAAKRAAYPEVPTRTSSATLAAIACGGLASEKLEEDDDECDA